MPVKRPEQNELAYTTRKIEANFSNFSAWHQRSKVLTSLWDSGKLSKVKSQEEGLAIGPVTEFTSPPEGVSTPTEFELVKNAMYTDPGDQSVWIYHRWLVGPGTHGLIYLIASA